MIVHATAESGADQTDIPTSGFGTREGIEHRKTTATSRQANGFVERLHRTILEWHSRAAGRESEDEPMDQMHQGLDADLVTHNHKRPHQGRNKSGLTPIRAVEKGRTKRPAQRSTPANRKPQESTLE